MNGLLLNVDDRIAALVDHRVDAHGGAAAEQRFELALVIVGGVERANAGHADRFRRLGIGSALELLNFALDKALGQRRDRQKRIDAQRARNDGAIGDVEALMHAAVAGEHPSEHVHSALQVIVAHRASTQRMRGNQVPQLEKTPGGIGNEAGAQRVRMAAQFLVHSREDLLLAGLVPGNLDAAVGLDEGLLEQDEAACIVLAHDQVEHGVVQRAVRIVRRDRWGRGRGAGALVGRPRFP